MDPNYKAMKKYFHFITIFMPLFLFIGCLYVPPVGRQIGNEELKTIEIGSTTKAEVTNLLGKPDLLENERFYVYEAGQNFGYIVVFIDPGGIGSLSEERYRLLFEFNVNEVVKRYHIEPIYLANWAGISDGWENPDNQTTSGKEALFQKTNFKELILLEHGFFFRRVAFSPDSKMVAAHIYQKGLWLKDLDTGEQYFLDKQRVLDFQYSPDGKSLAMIDKKGFVRILDINTWKEIVVFRGHGEVSHWRSGGTESLSYSPDGRMVATSGNKELKIWNPLTGVEIMTIDVPKWVTSIAFSPDGKLIAAVTGSFVSGSWDAVNIWDAVNGSHLGILDSKKEDNIEFSPKGRTLAVNKGTHLELWDVSQCEVDRSSSDSSQIGELLDVFILPSGKRVGESRQSFSSDGNIIAVSNGGNIVIWDIAQSREIRRFISNEVEYFHDVAFSPDGNYLVIIAGGGVYLCTVQSLYD
jgi:WD40 repeat protein